MILDFTESIESYSWAKPHVNVHDMIREAAYFNWLNAGCPEGRDLEFWVRAESEIRRFHL